MPARPPIAFSDELCPLSLPVDAICRRLLSGLALGEAIRRHPEGLLCWQRQRTMLAWGLRLAAVLDLTPMETSLVELLGKLALPAMLGMGGLSKELSLVGEVVEGLPELDGEWIYGVVGEVKYLWEALTARAPRWELVGRVAYLARHLQLDLEETFLGLPRTRQPLVRVGRDEGAFIQVVGDGQVVEEAWRVLLPHLERAGLELSVEREDRWWRELSRRRDHRVALAGHFDSHGILLTALTYQRLRQLGIDCQVALSYDWTGSVGRFWKRTLGRLAGGNPDWMVLHDLTLDSRRPERTLRALRLLRERLPEVRVVILDHHRDTLRFLGQLAGPRTRVVVGPAEAICFAPGLGQRERSWLLVAARNDKDLTVRNFGELRLFRDPPELGRRMEELTDRLGPAPKELRKNLLPYPGLLELGRGGERLLFNTREEERVTSRPRLSYRLQGRVVVTTERPPGGGRGWYEMLEGAMEVESERTGGDDPWMVWLRVSYAIAWRLLPDGSANLLFLTHWLEPGAMPIGWFVPPDYGPLIGYEQAGWIEIPPEEMESFIHRTVEAINRAYPRGEG